MLICSDWRPSAHSSLTGSTSVAVGGCAMWVQETLFPAQLQPGLISCSTWHAPKQPYLQLCWPELCSQEKGQKLSLVTQAGGMGSSLGCQAWAAASPRLPGWFSLYWQTWGSQPSKKQESHQMVSTEKLWFQVSPSAMPQQWFQRALQSQNSVTPTLPASPKQFSGLGVTVVVLMVGLDDLKSLFQPWWFYNSWPDLQL